MEKATRATLDPDALRGNFGEAQRLAAGRRVIAVVKADAYGHGARWVAQTLVAAGCDFFAVVSVAEAVDLRDAGIACPILVLGGARDTADARESAARGLTPVVHAPEDLERVAAAGTAEPIGVHVEVDTGMHRMGFPADGAPGFLAEVACRRGVRLEGVFTHLARADEPDLAPSIEQIRAFRGRIELARSKGVDVGMLHVVSSAGLLAGEALFRELPETHAVRPGLMLYGARPGSRVEGTLRPVMTLRTRVGLVRAVRAGDPVGYGARYRAPRDTRIATLPLGYADGVPIAATNRGTILIRGERFPIAGRVSMDYVTVDVGAARVEAGDEAIVFGTARQGALPIEEAAAAADTIAYELMVRVGARVPRTLEGDDA